MESSRRMSPLHRRVRSLCCWRGGGSVTAALLVLLWLRWWWWTLTWTLRWWESMTWVEMTPMTVWEVLCFVMIRRRRRQWGFRVCCRGGRRGIAVVNRKLMIWRRWGGRGRWGIVVSHQLAVKVSVVLIQITGRGLRIIATRWRLMVDVIAWKIRTVITVAVGQTASRCTVSLQRGHRK